MLPVVGEREIGVSVSGGADSMALLSLACEWGVCHGVRIKALTVDHGLRPEAALEANMVADWCLSRDIPHHVHRWNGVQAKGNILDAARHARLEAIGAWRGACSHILVGHTLTDRAETLVMRLMRGSGVDGLSGLQPVRRVEPDGYTIRRPLIDVNRQDIRTYCLTMGVPFCDDPSNDCEEYDRVKVRKMIQTLGLNEESLVKTARRQARARAVLEACVDDFRVQYVRRVDDGVSIDKAAFYEALEEIRLRVLVKAVGQVGQKAYPPREQAVMACDEAVRQGKGFALAGCLVRVSGKELRVSVERNRRS